jgi:hypothetical protein
MKCGRMQGLHEADERMDMEMEINSVNWQLMREAEAVISDSLLALF